MLASSGDQPSPEHMRSSVGEISIEWGLSRTKYVFQRHKGGGVKPTNSRSTASAKANAVKSRPWPAIA